MTDQPTSPGTDPGTAELERRIADLERRSPTRMMQQGRSGLEEAFWAVMHNMFPEEARKHLKAASREQLLAARVYLDRWIERLDEQQAETVASRAHEKIEVE
jgi:aromatic ring-opening dioxygenase catalytic subunit (LigB family)